MGDQNACSVENSVKISDRIICATMNLRKRRVKEDSWEKVKKKRERHSSQGFPNLPKYHHIEKSKLRCQQLNMQDIRRFHQGFYKSTDKIEQDCFILRYVKGRLPHRHRIRTDGGQERGMSIEYYIPSFRKERGSIPLRVCRNTFLGILKLSQYRVQNLCRRELSTGESPKERRGGARPQECFRRRGQSVRMFIENIHPLESHYIRGKTKRFFLSSDLSIRKLWEMYNKEQTDAELFVKYEYFRKIFVEDYNISFKSPATDQCSKCIELKERIQSTRHLAEKDNLKFNLALHKKQASVFFTFLREQEEGEITFTFDCQKNLVFPKIPDQLAYYKRQFYVYNFTICQGLSRDPQLPQNTFIYTWTEIEGRKGSSEIVSCVHERLTNTEFPHHIHTVRLFADSCGGQNKNSTMVSMLLYWLQSEAPSNIKRVVLYFPIPGHSFIPPDRVFGNIERQIRKLEEIILPDSYFSIFEKFGTIRRSGVDFHFRDWKTTADNTVKKPQQWHFKFATAKRFIISRSKCGQGLVQGEATYCTDLGAPKPIIRKGKGLNTMNPAVKKLGAPLNPKKVTDVKELLSKHFGPEWHNREDLGFYRDLLLCAEDIVQQNVSDEDDDPMEHDVAVQSNGLYFP